MKAPAMKLTMVIESAPEAIVVYTPQKFLFLKRFAADQLGSDTASVVGRPILELVHPDSVPFVVERIRNVLKSGEGVVRSTICLQSRRGSPKREANENLALGKSLA